MGRVTVDIKEWVANGRFEGEQKLHNREGTIYCCAVSNPLIFFSSFLSVVFYFYLLIFSLLFCTSLYLSFILYLPSSLYFLDRLFNS